MHKKLFYLSILPLLLAGCNDTTSPTSSSSSSSTTSSTSIIKKYTVKFANTDYADVEIEEGKTLAKPADPKKTNYLFTGWFYEASFVNEVQFPLIINSNLTIYANFYSYQDAFKKARNNTIGESVNGYEYDYTLDVDVSYMGLALIGKTIGNSKYNALSNDISFYDEHVNSGALFYDGSKYQIKKGRELHTISLDENDIVKKYDIKEVGDDYKYDSSSFAKAIFEYDDKSLKEISPTSKANEYKLKTSFNVSSGIALVGNYINHPIVEKLIGQLPETSVDTGMYVTFSSDKLNSYRYEMNIDVEGIKLSLIYSLTFKNIGVAPSITPKVFNNTYVSNSDIITVKAEINTYLDDYKNKEHSSYDFKAKTAVSYAKKNDINATIDGWSKRKVSSNEVYYLNDYEIDTDHKNADLYKDKGLGDCHGGRVKLSTGEVHDLKKKAILSGYIDVGIATHEDIDNYYLLDVLEMINSVSFIQKINDSKNGTITYAIGSNTASALNILKSFNNSLRLNPLKECSVDVKAFGDFLDSSFTVNDFEFNIIIANNEFSSLKLEMNGGIQTSFPNSRDFNAKQDAGYELEFNLSVTDKGSDYEPVSEVGKVK